MQIQLIVEFLEEDMTIQSPEEAALLATICDRGSAEPAIRTFMPLTASPELETPSFQHETTSPHAPAMAAKGEVADRVPAILSHVESAPCLSWGRRNITRAEVMTKTMVAMLTNIMNGCMDARF